MKNGNKSVLIRVLLASAFLLVMVSGALAQSMVAKGQVIPEDITLTKLDGGETTLKAVAEGKKTLVIFFNTSCSQCLKEIKWVAKKLPEINLALISIDFTGKNAVERWLKNYVSGIAIDRSTIYLDPEFTVPRRFGLTLTPSSILIDQDGKVAQAIAGFAKGDDATVEAFFK